MLAGKGRVGEATVVFATNGFQCWELFVVLKAVFEMSQKTMLWAQWKNGQSFHSDIVITVRGGVPGQAF